MLRKNRLGSAARRRRILRNSRDGWSNRESTRYRSTLTPLSKRRFALLRRSAALWRQWGNREAFYESEVRAKGNRGTRGGGVGRSFGPASLYGSRVARRVGSFQRRMRSRRVPRPSPVPIGCVGPNAAAQTTGRDTGVDHICAPITRFLRRGWTRASVGCSVGRSGTLCCQFQGKSEKDRELVSGVSETT